MPTFDPTAREQLNQRLAQALTQGRFQEALQEAERAEADTDTPATAPDVLRATTLELLGRLRREVGQYTLAEPPLLQALSYFGSLLGKDSPEYARCLHQLALLYEELAQYNQAEPLYRSALEIRQKILGEDHVEVAESLHDLAGLHDLMARYTEAYELYRRAREIRRMRLGENHPDYAASLTAEAWHLCRRGNLRRGETLARQALGIVQRTHGSVHPQLASSAQLLSRIALQQARIPEAEQFALRVNEVRLQILGETHHRYAGGLENLSFVRAMQGRGEEAERLARQGIEITRAALGERHPFYAEGLTAIGYALQSQHNYPEAEKFYRQALEVYRSVHGENHAFVAGSLRDLAEVCAIRESNAAAEEHFRRAMAIIEPNASHSPLEYLEMLDGLARVLTAQGRLDEALETTHKAVELARQTMENPGLLAGALESQARVTQANGQLEQAAELWKQAIQARSDAGGPDHPLCAEGLRNLAVVQQMQGFNADALETLKNAYSILSKALGDKHPDTLATLATLAETHAQAGELALAEELLVQVADLERERVGDQHPDYARIVQQLGRLYLLMNNLTAAEVRYREVLQIVRREHGEEHPEYARALMDLAQLHHQVNDLGSAAQFYQLAAEIRRNQPGEDHPDYAETVLGLAQVFQGMGRNEDAEPLFRQAVQIQRAALGENAMPTLRARHSFALFLQATGRLGEAMREMEQAAERLAEGVGLRSPLLTPILNDQARLANASGDHLRAEQLFLQVQTIHLEAFANDPTVQAQDLVNLAITSRALGELAQTQLYLLRALELLEENRSPDHPDLLTVRGMLGNALAQNDRPDEADQLFAQVIERTRVTLGQMHPMVGSLLSERAHLALNRGQLPEALALYEEATEVARVSQGEDNGDYVNLLRLQASVHQLLGQNEQAEALYKQRITILRRLFGPTSSVVAPAQQALADFYRSCERYDEATQLARQALDSLRRAARPTPPDSLEDVLPGPMPMVPPPLATPMAAANLAALLLAQDQYTQAEPLLRQALHEARDTVGDDHPATASVLFQLAVALILSGREAEALTLMEQLQERDSRLWPRLMSLMPDQMRAMACQSLHEHHEAYLSLCTQQRLGELVASDLRTGELVHRLLGMTLRRKRTGTEVLAKSPWESWSQRHPTYRDELYRLFMLERQVASALWNGANAENREYLEILLETWTTGRDRLENNLRENIPELAQRRQLARVTPETVQACLPDGFALVEILHFRESDFRLTFKSEPHERVQGRYLAFVLKKDVHPWMIDLGTAADLEPKIAAWRAELERGQLSPDAAGLRAAVVDRLWPLLADCSGLVLAADGEALTVPLDVLPCEGGLLLDRFTIRHVLCGRDLLRQPSPHGPYAPSGVIPAAPSAGVSSWWRSFWGGGSAETRLLRLLQATPITQVSDFPEAAPELLHVARPCHFLGGEFKPGPWVNPLTQAVVHMPAGSLDAREITTLNLWGTRSVFLAALQVPCLQPGVWPRFAGLLASFFLAGTKSVTYRLWQPPVEAQTALETQYYEHVKRGLSAPCALEAARAEVRRRWPSPVAWAGWISLGDVDPDASLRL
jgi:tetratricopeptide (TPR) repeat protein